MYDDELQAFEGGYTFVNVRGGIEEVRSYDISQLGITRVTASFTTNYCIVYLCAVDTGTLLSLYEQSHKLHV